MKISVDWLNTYLSNPAGADEIESLLTDQGLPIDGRDQAAGAAGDCVLDVEVTSNRSDCLSHVGLAREVAAGSGRAVATPDCQCQAGQNGGATVESLTAVENQNANLCPLYTARVIQGVKVGPSPGWLVARLEAVGLRPINNVVDITNFVLLELGQPLHAFDMAKLDGGRIVVRAATKGETIEAIDGSVHKLDPATLVIADAKRPVAIAGVMGGMGSRVTEQTTDVLLESAVFDPLSVRRTSRALKLASDSSYRFERGVDPVGVDAASRRAAKLICELAGGRLADGVIRVGSDEPMPDKVQMRIDRCNGLLGLSLAPGRVVDLLEKLGFKPQLDGDKARVTCTVPTYRLDVSREVDLIEEVARLHGFDAVPVNQKIHIIARPTQARVAAGQKAGGVLTAHGYHEAITFSFVSPKHGQPFVPQGHEPLEVEDERRKAEPMLRPSVLPSLLACRKSNQDMGNRGVRLFEFADTWSCQGGKIIEHSRLAMICDAGDRQQALRDVRGTIEELVHRLMGQTDVTFVPVDAPSYTHAAQIEAGGQHLGVMGLLSPDRQDLFNLQTPVVAAELDLPTLLRNYPPQPTVRALARFPAIERDLSIVVQDEVTWDGVQQQVLACEPALLEDVQFLGVYRGKPIPAGHKSVSFRMLYRDPAATLRHEQVDPQVAAIVERLNIHLGAQLRG